MKYVIMSRTALDMNQRQTVKGAIPDLFLKGWDETNFDHPEWTSNIDEAYSCRTESKAWDVSDRLNGFSHSRRWMMVVAMSDKADV